MLLNIFSFYTNSCGSRILSPVFTPPSPHTHTHKHSASRLNFYLSVFLINLWWTGTVLRWSKYYENPKWNHNTIIYIYCKRLFANPDSSDSKFFNCVCRKKMYFYMYTTYISLQFLISINQTKMKMEILSLTDVEIFINCKRFMHNFLKYFTAFLLLDFCSTY